MSHYVEERAQMDGERPPRIRQATIHGGPNLRQLHKLSEQLYMSTTALSLGKQPSLRESLIVTARPSLEGIFLRTPGHYTRFRKFVPVEG